MVAAAVIGSAVVGAAGSAVAGHEASDASKKGTKAAISEERAAREQTERLSAPYRALGEKGISTYEDLLGIGSKGASGIQETLSQLPGYQFAREQGIEGTARQAAAGGMNLSGNQLTAVQEFGTNLADQTYGEQLNRLLQPIQIGQAAASGQAANVTNSANNIANLTTRGADDIAGIRANTAAGITGAIQGGINGAVTQNTLAGLNSPGKIPTYSPSNTPGDPGFSGPLHP